LSSGVGAGAGCLVGPGKPRATEAKADLSEGVQPTRVCYEGDGEGRVVLSLQYESQISCVASSEAWCSRAAW
jgi:hypothetical protein